MTPNEFAVWGGSFFGHTWGSAQNRTFSLLCLRYTRLFLYYRFFSMKCAVNLTPVAVIGVHQVPQTVFEWKPEYWQGWREAASPYRQFKSEHDRALAVGALQLHQGEMVLEVGCGYGWVSKALLDAARIRWFGVDPGEDMVRHLRASLNAYQPTAIVGCGSQLPFASSTFDKVLCTGVLMHVPDDFAVLREMERVLRPGGILLCSMNNALSPFSWLEWLRNRLKKGFTQRYRLPRSFQRYLKNTGLNLERIDGDGLFAISAFRIGRLWLPPASMFPGLRLLDRWLIQHAPWLAHEVWFTVAKVPDSHKPL